MNRSRRITLASLSIMSVLAVSCAQVKTVANEAPHRSLSSLAVSLETVAVRVYDLPAMEKFYHHVFGAALVETQLGSIKGLQGTIGGMTFKFVPIRKEGPDFVGFPSHQPGFRVPDLAAALHAVNVYGGRLMGEVVETESGRCVGVRDPDGNTIEIYGPAD